MRLTDPSIKLSVDPTIDRLLFVFSLIALALIQPFYTWSNDLVISRIAHGVGSLLLLYILINKKNWRLFNIVLVLFFFLVSLHTMIGGTENTKITYIPLITLFFIALKPSEQARIFDHFSTILAIIFFIGLVSYFLYLIGKNPPLGTAIAPNFDKWPYLVYFGHVKETNLPVYRFSSIFDEAGQVGTLCGLILASVSISFKNIKSIILLATGLITFSLAFYVILIFILLYNLKIKTLIIVSFLTITTALVSGDRFDILIASRLSIENGRLSGDNRTDPLFEAYYSNFLSNGGNDLIFGKGFGTFQKEKPEGMSPSTYKTLIFNYGILGFGMMIFFYFLSVFFLNNSKKGWFLCFIFFISAYQRPDLIRIAPIVMFLGGLSYLKLKSINENTTASTIEKKIIFSKQQKKEMNDLR